MSKTTKKKIVKLPPLEKQEPPLKDSIGLNGKIILFSGNEAKLCTMKVKEYRRGKVRKTDAGKLQLWDTVLEPVGFKCKDGEIVIPYGNHAFTTNTDRAFYEAFMQFPYVSGEERLLQAIFKEDKDTKDNDEQFKSLVILAGKHFLNLQIEDEVKAALKGDKNTKKGKK